MNLAKSFGVVAVVIGIALAPAGSAFAQKAFLGSWTLDAAKSQGPGGQLPTSLTLEISDAGGGMYKSASVTDVAGITVRSELTFGIDGKDYTPVTTPTQPGMPAVTQSVERVSDTVYKSTIKIGGQVAATSLNELSADGKTLTQTTTGVGQFAAISGKLVFNRK